MRYYKYDESLLKFIPIKYRVVFIKIFIIVTSLWFFYFIIFTPKQKEKIEFEKVLLVEEQIKFTEKNLIKLIDRLNFRHPHIVLAQAKLESGNYSSKVFIENNNLMGMKEAKVRINLAKGTKNNHAYYDNWVESILCYGYWYSTYASKSKTEEQFYNLLGRMYAEDPNYLIKLKSIINNNNLKNKFK